MKKERLDNFSVAVYDVHDNFEVVTDLNSDGMAAQIRSERDRLLKEFDWTQLPDAPVDQQAWAEYRQALRDVPQQAGFPTEITWPVKPE